MPVKLQPQFYIIIGVVVFCLFVGVVVMASNASHKALPKATPTPAVADPTTIPPPATITFTVNSVVGISSIAVVNQNTNAKMILIPSELPHTYTVNYGDTLTFKVTSITGYRFNAWVFGDSSFHSPDSSGYLIWKITYPLIMEPHFLMDVTP